MMMRTAASVFALLGAVSTSALAADFPDYYPKDYAQSVVAAAEKEGKLVIYSATDAEAAKPILRDFEKLYPKVPIEYNDLNSTELYNRLISEVGAGQGSGDLTWSSAVDLQMKLVLDGYAQEYASPEASKVPAWAVYKGLAWGSTFEPVAFAYNKRLLPAELVPKTHADFAKLLNDNKDKFKGKVGTYDPERSGTGFVYLSQDAVHNPQIWDLVKALGAADTKLYTSTGTMLERIGSGEHTLGYNIIGSYIINRMKKDPSMAIVYPEDYIEIVSRAMLIPKAAKHPAAAKLFVDYILSQRGQKVIAEQAGLFSMRADVEGEGTAKALTAKYGDKLKPIPIDESITKYLDQEKRLAFLKDWQTNFKK